MKPKSKSSVSVNDSNTVSRSASAGKANRVNTSAEGGLGVDLGRLTSAISERLSETKDARSSEGLNESASSLSKQGSFEVGGMFVSVNGAASSKDASKSPITSRIGGEVESGTTMSRGESVSKSAGMSDPGVSSGKRVNVLDSEVSRDAPSGVSATAGSAMSEEVAGELAGLSQMSSGRSVSSSEPRSSEGSSSESSGASRGSDRFESNSASSTLSRTQSTSACESDHSSSVISLAEALDSLSPRQGEQLQANGVVEKTSSQYLRSEQMTEEGHRETRILSEQSSERYTMAGTSEVLQTLSNSLCETTNLSDIQEMASSKSMGMSKNMLDMESASISEKIGRALEVPEGQRIKDLAEESASSEKKAEKEQEMEAE